MGIEATVAAMMTAAAGNFNKFRVSDSSDRAYRTAPANR
jgi:hypothetical protein